MSNHGHTHMKKSDQIKNRKFRKTIVKYDIPLVDVNEGECYGRIVQCLGCMQFKAELLDGTQVRAIAGNTFKNKGKKNPKAERINVGQLVKIHHYLDKYLINHIYTKDDEVELEKQDQLLVKQIVPENMILNNINESTDIEVDWSDI